MKRLVILPAAGAFAVLLIAVLLDLAGQPPQVDLPAAVAARLAESGVRHPVTAVLLNFRGYDTLLEVAVLLLALLGVLAVGGCNANKVALPVDPVLSTVARPTVPVMLLVAIYLLWAGAHQPGGAFQAGAVLAGCAVLLFLAGLMPGWATPGLRLRLGLALGLSVFLLAAAALLAHGALLYYPPAWAGELILLIETTLTFSLGLILAGLFLFLETSAQRAARAVCGVTRCSKARLSN